MKCHYFFLSVMFCFILLIFMILMKKMPITYDKIMFFATLTWCFSGMLIDGIQESLPEIEELPCMCLFLSKQS